MCEKIGDIQKLRVFRDCPIGGASVLSSQEIERGRYAPGRKQSQRRELALTFLYVEK